MVIALVDQFCSLSVISSSREYDTGIFSVDFHLLNLKGTRNDGYPTLVT
jgi:hypothetical protein